ncbi:MAG: ABC transporter substrate-binding protein [Desulfuromonadaceae bacterium]|nr:ABC transporter substrate-binding protein [Desulfuromonadaceae bacterium]MDD2856122.1 ABC transporter substrate-binding protein [Desulfuromonadaceae bacterium]
MIIKYLPFLISILLATPLYSAPLTPDEDLSQSDIMRLGEQMYRNGVLPSGEYMPAYIRGDTEVDSGAFSCSSCHLRAGLGSYEGGVVTPPTTGRKLYEPYRRPPSLGDTVDQTGRYIYAKTVQERPSYNRTTLASALRFGVDPVGQKFNDVMPRYPLSDRDMTILIRYLEFLSHEPSPGASSSEFRFATIITDDVSPEERKALLNPLQNFMDRKNQQLALYNDYIKFGYIPTAEMKYAFRKASLDIWDLKGDPSTWRKQLENYNAAKPVFAILGGISNQNWKPVHDFCESERIPSLFPITDFPVVSDTSWYTYYFNKGYAQEGEGAAKYLNRLIEDADTKTVLQVVQDSEVARALASGFENSWKEMERSPIKSIKLTAGELADNKTLNKILSSRRTSVLLLWADAETLPQLKKTLSRLKGRKIIFMSSGYLGKKAADISDEVRKNIYLTWPYRLTPYIGPQTGQFDARVPIVTSVKDFGESRITSRTVAMLLQAALQGLNKIYDNLYRDHFMDVMSMQMDLTVRDYERLSFGPGQRYVSKGCYIIQLGHGKNPELIPRSEWVIQ